MELIQILNQDGYQFKRVASTNGGEYAGPCPFCRGGKDRFRVWPNQGKGRYWCRQCDAKGDTIQYLRDKRGLSFHDSCRLLGLKKKGFKKILSTY